MEINRNNIYQNAYNTLPALDIIIGKILSKISVFSMIFFFSNHKIKVEKSIKPFINQTTANTPIIFINYSFDTRQDIFTILHNITVHN